MASGANRDRVEGVPARNAIVTSELRVEVPVKVMFGVKVPGLATSAVNIAACGLVAVVVVVTSFCCVVLVDVQSLDVIPVACSSPAKTTTHALAVAVVIADAA